MIGRLLLALILAQTALLDDVSKFTTATANEERFTALTAMLSARNIPFTVEPFAIDKPREREPRTEGRNVVVTIGEGEREIVIGAHYDARRLPDGTLSKGAVDNAASSVILVRLAERLLAEKPPVRIRIVWFDMEEIGLIGSQQYVQKHAGDKIVAMVNFDINANGKTILFAPSERPDNAAIRRALVETCALENAACVGFPQLPPSDDRSFTAAGIPTVSIGVVPPIEAHQLWLLLNAGPNSGLAPNTAPATLRTIHTPEDTLEKVSEETMTMMVRFALSLTRILTR